MASTILFTIVIDLCHVVPVHERYLFPPGEFLLGGTRRKNRSSKRPMLVYEFLAFSRGQEL